MEFLIFFAMSFILCVVSGYLYLKKEDTDYSRLNRQVLDLHGAVKALEVKTNDTRKEVLTTEVINVVNDRITSVEVEIAEIKKNPPVMNVVLKQPVKVLMKQIPSAPISVLPGLTPKLKKQMNKLAQ